MHLQLFGGLTVFMRMQMQTDRAFYVSGVTQKNHKIIFLSSSFSFCLYKIATFPIILTKVASQ